MQQPKHARPFVVNGDTAGAEWSTPQPLVGQIERESYPLDMLPAFIRGAIAEVIDTAQAPPEMVASSALAVCSLAAQSLADVSRSRTLRGPCSLFFLTVAESGDRKSTVDSYFTRAVRHYEDEQRDASRQSLADHAASVAAWEVRRAAVSGDMAAAAKNHKGTEAHQADLARIEGEKPRDPRVPRLLYEDVTSERLGKALALEWPSAAILSSEGGDVLSGHSMGKDMVGRTLALDCKMWDGATHIVDRATAQSFAVRGARLTMHLQVQPHVLTDFLKRDRGMSRGSGFLARFLISVPKSLQGTRAYREPGEMPELTLFSRRIAELLRETLEIDSDRGLVLQALDMTPDAKALWVKTYNDIEGELKSSGDFAPIRDVASKMADNIARLAAVLHIFECGPRGQISRECVESAAAIVIWHGYNARAVLAQHTMSKETANAATLDRWLIDRCQMENVDHFSTRVVLQSGPLCTRNKDDLYAAVEVLSGADRARVLQLGKRRLLKVNPALLIEGDADDDASPSDDASTGREWNGHAP